MVSIYAVNDEFFIIMASQETHVMMEGSQESLCSTDIVHNKKKRTNSQTADQEYESEEEVKKNQVLNGEAVN